MTLTIPADQFVVVPKNGIALATLTDGGVVLQLAATNGPTAWFMLSTDLTRWLTEALATYTR